MRNRHQQQKTTKTVMKALVCALPLALGACGEITSQHGYVPSQSALDQIQIGSSKEQVRLIMGTPSTAAAIQDNVYFYISEIREQRLFFAPETTERRVLTFHFDNDERVERIANYGLKDGVVFDFITRTTRTRGDSLTALRQILGNIGNFNEG
jgi:outer membrane protein assembly factor BamE (lipoprotein component of BamABCDE complex)